MDDFDRRAEDRIRSDEADRAWRHARDTADAALKAHARSMVEQDDYVNELRIEARTTAFLAAAVGAMVGAMFVTAVILMRGLW